MIIKEESLDESMSGDTKEKTGEQSWEEITQAINTNLDADVNQAGQKLDKLERLVQERKAKPNARHRQNQRQVPPPRISEEWHELQEENIFENPLMRKLQRSFLSIKSPLRLRLLSLAIFPKNSIIKRRSLIYWWIGEGLVSQRGDKTAEQVGEEVYDELLKEGLIEPDDNDPSPLMNRCKMNPLIRYMLMLVAEAAGFFYFPSKNEMSPENEMSPGLETLQKCSLSSSHLRLLEGAADDPQDKHLAKNEDVRTVFNVNQQYLSLQHHSLSDMKKLVVLQLGRWQHSPMYHIEVDNQKFLDELGVHHKHLKFLSLRGISRITSLPDSIVQLVNLEILDLRACHNLEKLPEDIASLKKLTHLDVSECYLIERMPKGTEKLASLQVLKGFVIGTARKNPCRISDLRKLTKLRRLSIYIGRGAARWEEQFAPLKEVTSLRSLTISWGVTSPELPSRPEMNPFLPQQLEKLELIGIPEASISKWLNPQELKNLKKLYIIGGKLASWDHQQQNEQWSVEILRLKHLKEFRIGNKEDVLKKFPRLGYFERSKCGDDDIVWYKRRVGEKGF
ncbi:hypothetical protein EUGRSUZ_J01169 [Eucalyptus grandis]|uniref:NB-ARC domain-containing protein n=2 Tax=Eucalyptus grandis TaxID=71139 RepID=A0A059AC71_EUCGR|nr:hypothetical protein EUGRSUZ_J01169 [Eucalyptus grandis]